jgi:predicted phosphodiesterase
VAAIRRLGSTAALLFLCCSCATLAPRQDSPWTYIVAADPQLYMKQADDSKWQQAVRAVNDRAPEFLIICGDLVNAENDAKKWRDPKVMAHHDSLARDYWKSAKKLSMPLYNVAGNHDVALQPTAETVAWYRKNFGEPWYSFTHRDSLFVVVESNLIRDPAGAPELANKQWRWIESTLRESDKHKYAHKSMYMHHPLCKKDVNEADDYFNIQLEPRQRLLKLLHAHGFKTVFCGHLHRNAYARDGDLEIITTSSCCAPLGSDPRGFRVVTVHPDRLEHHYVPVEPADSAAAPAKQ